MILWLAAILGLTLIMVALLPIWQLSRGAGLLDQALRTPNNTARLDAAITALEAARASNQHNPTLYRYLGRAYTQARRPKDALAAYQQAHTLAPDSLLISAELAATLEASGHPADAYALWDQQLLANMGVPAYIEMLMRGGNYIGASLWLDRASAAGVDLSSTHDFLAYLDSLAEGNPGRAYDALWRSTITDNGWTSPELRFEAWGRLGLWYVEQQRPTDAVPVLEQAIRLDPGNTVPARLRSDVYRNLGLIRWNTTSAAKALPLMLQARSLDPQSVWAHIHYGKVLFISRPQRIEEVRASFATALALGDQRGALYWNLIDFWRWQNRPNEADALCRQVVAVGSAEDLVGVARIAQLPPICDPVDTDA